MTEVEDEILLRLREIQSHLLRGDRMLITNFEERLNVAVERVKGRYGAVLPFRGKYLDAFHKFTLSQTKELKLQAERFFKDGDYHGFVDFVIDLARGNLPLPFYLKPFSGLFLEGLRHWLHSNTDLFKDGIVSQQLPEAN